MTSSDIAAIMVIIMLDEMGIVVQKVIIFSPTAGLDELTCSQLTLCSRHVRPGVPR